MTFKNIDNDLHFATAVTMFGLILKESKYIIILSWNDIENIAKDHMNTDDYLQNEFLTIS